MRAPPSHDKLLSASLLMDRALSESTGLDEVQRKLVTYWTLATHFLPHVNFFSMIALQGKMGTGKSQTLSIIENFAFRPVRLSLRGMTAPTIRDKFAESCNGTAIVEEADAAWKDGDNSFEHLLSDRCQRATATASHKVKSSDQNWTGVTKQYFGATAIHRRNPFKDAALDGRRVCVRFLPNHTRRYREYSAQDPWNQEGKELLHGLQIKPVEVERPEGVAGRIFDTYKLLISAAKMWGDQQFTLLLRLRLSQETLELKEAQSSELDGLVLQAIVERVCTRCFGDGDPTFDNIKYGDLSKLIFDNHRVPVLPRQIGPIARDLGFSTKVSHGVTVVVPTPATLLKACDECDYADEAIEKLRQRVLSAGNDDT